MAADDHALVVGINLYPALGDLGGAENDARAFAAWLAHPRGGNVPNANISLIVSSDHAQPGTHLDARPQIADIERVFDSYFLRGMDAGRAGRRLYLYFAGHGFAPDLEDAALFMANAAKGMTGYHVTGRPYANWFRKAGYYDEVVLFMDCCRDVYKRARPRMPPYEDITATNPGERFFAFATKWSRKAREGPWGYDATTRGIFTLTLLEALRNGAPRDANGQVRANDLEAYVINEIRRKAQQLEGGAALDDPEFDFNHTVDLLFNTPPAEAAVNDDAREDGNGVPFGAARWTVRTAPADGLTYSLTRGDGTVIAAKTRQPHWSWPVDRPGLYKLTRSDGTRALFEVIGEGRTIDVEL